MTVQELINKLATYQPDMPVMFSQDEEGNDFQEIGELETGLWDKEECEMIHPDDTEDYEDGELLNVVVVWP